MPKLPNDFFSQVYQVVQLIPAGRVTTYGAIAAFLGAKRSSRMVGYAMNAAFTMDDGPAHRVINRNGLLTGKMHFATPTAMQELLLAEGVEVEDDCVKNLDKVFWSPEEIVQK